MTNRAAIRAEAMRLRALFEAAGADPVETGILQPADLLLEIGAAVRIADRRGVRRQTFDLLGDDVLVLHRL